MSRRIRFMSLLGCAVSMLFVLSVLFMSGVIDIYKDLVNNNIEGNKYLVLDKQVADLINNDFWVKGNIVINNNQHVNIEGNITSIATADQQAIQTKDRRSFTLEATPVNKGVVLKGVGLKIKGYIENGQVMLENGYEQNWLDLFGKYNLAPQDNRDVAEIINSLLEEFLVDSIPRFEGITYYEDDSKNSYTCCVLSLENEGDIDNHIELTLNNSTIFKLSYEMRIDKSINMVIDIWK